MPVSMPFPLPFSMYGAIEDALRLSWAVRKKPLESFLLPRRRLPCPAGLAWWRAATARWSHCSGLTARVR